MLNLAAVATVFGLTFLAELPDKSLFASLLLGTRYRPLYVWAGVAAAFLVQMAVAVTAGQTISDLLNQMKSKALEASDTSLSTTDRAATVRSNSDAVRS